MESFARTIREIAETTTRLILRAIDGETKPLAYLREFAIDKKRSVGLIYTVGSGILKRRHWQSGSERKRKAGVELVAIYEKQGGESDIYSSLRISTSVYYYDVARFHWFHLRF